MALTWISATLLARIPKRGTSPWPHVEGDWGWHKDGGLDEKSWIVCYSNNLSNKIRWWFTCSQFTYNIGTELVRNEMRGTLSLLAWFIAPGTSFRYSELVNCWNVHPPIDVQYSTKGTTFTSLPETVLLRVEKSSLVGKPGLPGTLRHRARWSAGWEALSETTVPHSPKIKTT